MKVALAADHAGFELKETLRAYLPKLGHEIIDLGTDSDVVPGDYPIYAQKIGLCVLSGKAERGVLVCGSGVGANIAANKIKGIYAGLCHDTYSAHQGVEHAQMNVLCLGARVVGVELAREIVRTFLNAKFSNEERHVRRVGEIRALENQQELPDSAGAQSYF